MTTQVGAAPRATAHAPTHAGRVSRVVAWSILPVYVAGVSASLVLDHRLGSPGLELLEGAMLWVGFGMFAAMGALLIGKRPHNAVGWVMAAAALLVMLGATGDLYAAWVMTTRGRPDALAVVGAWVQSWYWLLLLWPGLRGDPADLSRRAAALAPLAVARRGGCGRDRRLVASAW